MDRHRLGLRQLPSGPDVDDVMDNVITVVMNEGEGSTFVGYRQRKLIVINQTDLGIKAFTHLSKTDLYLTI